MAAPADSRVDDTVLGDKAVKMPVIIPILEPERLYQNIAMQVIKLSFKFPHFRHLEAYRTLPQSNRATEKPETPENEPEDKMARKKSQKEKGKSKADKSPEADAPVQADNSNLSSSADPIAASPSSADPKAPQEYLAPFYSQPHSGQRLSRADFKGYLDFDSSQMTIYSYWNIDVVERTWSTFRSVRVVDGVIHAIQIPHAYPFAVERFYRNLKGILMTWCKDGGFRGGAFGEIHCDSPLYDILQFIYWSPVLIKEQRQVFRYIIMKIHDQVHSTLMDAELNQSCDEAYFKQYNAELEWIGAFFHINSGFAPPPMPNDISEAWLREFGPKFTSNYHLALAGDPAAPFKVASPRRDISGMAMEGYELGPDFLHKIKEPVKTRMAPITQLPGAVAGQDDTNDPPYPYNILGSNIGLGRQAGVQTSNKAG